MKFFDAHLHCKNGESGGFLVGLEGTPHFEGTWSNDEVLREHKPEKGYWAFRYVTAGAIRERFSHAFLKYHPRREQYTPDEVIASIRRNAPECVMLDTLNEPWWQPYDYWNIARAFPDIPFIFAHAGGYLIQDFIKICHFQPNVRIDFSLTHTVLGKLGDRRAGLPCIHEAIVYSLHAPFRERVLLASDFPFFSQRQVAGYYGGMGEVEMLNRNFETFTDQLRSR